MINDIFPISTDFGTCTYPAWSPASITWALYRSERWWASLFHIRKAEGAGKGGWPCSEHKDPPSQTHISAGLRASLDIVFSTKEKDLTVPTQGLGASENNTSTIVISPSIWNVAQTIVLKRKSPCICQAWKLNLQNTVLSSCQTQIKHPEDCEKKKVTDTCSRNLLPRPRNLSGLLSL